MKHSPAYHHALNAVAGYDAATDRLVRINAQSNIIALDKTLRAIRRSTNGNRSATVLLLSLVSDRITRAAYEVHFCVHPDKEFKL